ncbi:tetratricopeptide repeat protein [uncultured Alistipes sp.]|uniref:tetratricopeptide repeat protein n=1 Tax=uncultured Alistipes sp. TaxID=538949 RepID=UPI0026302168|nr:tetratricopeptide repeat protein [uncultured Alistipes sp.]
MQKASLNPTPDQTFEVIGEGPYDFVRVLRHSRELQQSGDVEGACNERFKAFQRLAELIPEQEEVILEWNHRNSRAALELIEASAIDHFLINDFEMSAALLEMLLELDPEDHLEGSELLAFDYLAMDEQELFDEVINDISDKSASRELLLLWSAYRRDGRLPQGELKRFRTRFAPYFAEFTAAEHPADDVYLRDIESERPSVAAQARELWLRTENLWVLWPGFIDALRASR